MRYEPPCVVRRERLMGLLTVANSNVKPDNNQVPSDVHVKDNIVAVTFGDETIAYVSPQIADRQAIAGLLGASQSAVKPDGQGISDVHVKDNIAPVTFGEGPAEYAAPQIAGREAIEGLLLDSAQSDVKRSDVRVKDNIVPVRW